MRKKLLGVSAISVVCLGGAAIGCGSLAPDASDGAAGASAGSAALGGANGNAGSASSFAGETLAGGSAAGGSAAGSSGTSGSSGTGSSGASGSGSSGAAGANAQGGAAGSGGSTQGAAGSGGAASTPDLKVVAYLANYSGSYSSWAKKISFDKMTHLNLAFATVTSSNDWDMGASDADVKTLVDTAHAAGVKVLASLGGGGGDGSIFNNWANMDAMLANLDPFLTRLNLDGADIDIENPGEVGAITSTNATNYDKFVEAIVAKLHPEGKLVTAAVAPWVGGPRASTLEQFDFVNIMVYTSNLSDYTNGVNFFKILPKTKMTLGAGFYGANSDDSNEISYAQIMAADPTAYSKNSTQVGGTTYYYTGEAAMKSICAMAKNYGGIMVWDLTEDVTGSHSLWTLVQNAM
ncbi:MAG TPA: glycosyl hydrolase family 18 protein [Polyangiaceae bacterium]|jgi:chitinase|nr:glycosyl hydrolase family 18 protein [Polyangiaceae bacterium]